MKTRPYEYGELRSVLLRCARERLEQVGHENLELRELAALAGASRSAPHYYFPSRNSLLAELALEGWTQLESTYERAAAAPGAPSQRLAAVCRAYVDFVAQAPQLFRLMFDLGRSPGYVSEKWVLDAMRTYRIYEDLFAEALQPADPRRVRAAALACWSSIYGFAQLRTHLRFGELLEGVESEDALLDDLLAHHIPGLRPAEREPNASDRRAPGAP